MYVFTQSMIHNYIMISALLPTYFIVDTFMLVFSVQPNGKGSFES